MENLTNDDPLTRDATVRQPKKVLRISLLIFLLVAIGFAIFIVKKNGIKADTVNATNIKINGSEISIQLPKTLADSAKKSILSSQSRTIQDNATTISSLALTAILQDQKKVNSTNRSVQTSSSPTTSSDDQATTKRDYIINLKDENGRSITAAPVATQTQTSCQPDSNTISFVMGASIPENTRAQLKSTLDVLFIQIKNIVGPPLVSSTITIEAIPDQGDLAGQYWAYKNQIDFVQSTLNSFDTDTMAHELSHAFQNHYLLGGDQAVVEGEASAIGEIVGNEFRFHSNDTREKSSATYDFLISKNEQYTEGGSSFKRLYIENKDVFSVMNCTFYKNKGVTLNGAYDSIRKLMTSIDGQPIKDWWGGRRIFNPAPASAKYQFSEDFGGVYMYKDSVEKDGVIEYALGTSVKKTAFDSSGRSTSSTCNTIAVDNPRRFDFAGTVPSHCGDEAAGSLPSGRWAKIQYDSLGLDAIPFIRTGVGVNPYSQLSSGIYTSTPFAGREIRFTEPESNKTLKVSIANGVASNFSAFSENEKYYAKKWKIEYACDSTSPAVVSFNTYNSIGGSMIFLQLPNLKPNSPILSFTPAKKTVSVSNNNPVVADITISSSTGRAIRTVATAIKIGSTATDIVWNGRDNNNRPVPSGIYMLRMTGTDGICNSVNLSRQITI